MRRQLTVLVAATACLVLVAFLIPLALLVRTVAADRAITAASGRLQSVVVLLAGGDRAALALGLAGVGRPVTVYPPDGSVLGTPAPRTPAVRLAATGRSLSTDTPAGREMVVAVGRSDGVYVIRTVVTRAELGRGVGRAWAVLAGLGVLLILLGVLVADRLARTVVVPVRDLSAVSLRLAAGDLTARAAPGGPPEVREVSGALNHLAGRIVDLLARERERVADVSHRLRTPLTALRLEAETLADPDEAARVRERVDAVHRAVTELIRTARDRTDGPGSCDATAVVADRVRFWSVLAEDTDRSFAVDVPDHPVPVGLPAAELSAAVDAALGNVFAHTADRVPFAVRLVAAGTGAGAVLTVSDEGPGLPETVGRGVSGGDSTGLGLDIIRGAARASGGDLELGVGAAGGTVLTIRLGPAFTSR